ncbi:MAG: DUF1634 domain-containing protein [Spirochaetia bacterium]|nr:DUF1634 domain-containing protein [Spirochaetia bacterium]
MRNAHGPTDRQVERFIGGLLRVGVIVAASIVGAGGIWYLSRHGRDIARFSAFHGEPQSLRSVGGIIGAALSLHSDALIQLGLLVLIAVPIVRVAVSIVAFALERDWLYSVVTILVLAILLFSLLGGAR